MSSVSTASPEFETSDLRNQVGVSIVVPCYNEADACGHFFKMAQALRNELDDQYDLTFILVDDGSSDGTMSKLRELFANDRCCKFISHPENRGVGAAIMTGIQHAETEIVCSMDFDCSYDPHQFLRLIPMLQDGVDVVTASPYHPDGLVENVPHWRLALSKAASVLYSYLLHNQLCTYTSCFRVYRRRSVANINLRNNGFVGVVELLWEVDRRGGKIVECPATLGVREYGQSKMRTLNVMLGHLRLMLSGVRRR